MTLGRPTRRAALAGGLALASRAAAQPVAPFGDAQIRATIVHRIETQKRGTGIVVGQRSPSGRSSIAYGAARLGGPAVDTRSIFPIASLTKIFTALLLSDAAVRGRLSVDDPVARHLPARVVVPSFQGRQITLADLASHGSGLPRRPPNLAGTDPDDPYAGYRTADLYAGVSAFTLTRPPGSEFEYSNFAYGLLGQALEHRLGRSFGELVRARITAPLGMADTGLAPPAPGDPRRVQGYSLELQPTPPWDVDALPEAGSLFSTVGDLLTFLGLWTAPPAGGLAKAARAMLALDRPGDQDGVRMALGWRRMPAAGGRTVIWSNGSAGGARAFMGVCLEDRRAVAGFNNAETGVGMDDIGLRVLGVDQTIDMSVPVARPEITLAPERLAAFVGVYALAADDTVIIRREGRTLAAQVGKQALRIYPETQTRFFMKDVEVQIDFWLGPDGTPTGLVWTQDGVTTRYPRRPAL